MDQSESLQKQLSFEVLSDSEETARLIMQWRNDRDTRLNSFDQKEKAWPEFRSEFSQRYFGETLLPCYFILLDGERVGLLGFHRSASINGLQTATVSINLAPERRAKGLGTAALKAVVPLLRVHGIQCLAAEVMAHNPASQKAFARAGYAPCQEYEKKLFDPIAGADSVKVQLFISDISRHFSLNGRMIGEGKPCYIIAEAGSNWKIGNTEKENKEMARKLIDVAKECGADAVKFQTFKAKSTYVSNAGASDYLRQSGEVRNVFDLIKDLEMPYDLVLELSDYAKSSGITFLTTAFSVDDLKAIDACVPMHKIASYENSHLRLLEAAAATGKPLIMSTGASPLDEIDWSVAHFRKHSNAPLCLMQCTAAYPAPTKSLHLRTIPSLRSRYDCLVGLSDHSRDSLSAPLMALALGASCLEKHFTLNNQLPGPDHRYAIEPHELRKMVDGIRNAEEALGDGFKQVAPEEEELFKFAKRSLQALVEIKPGDIIEEDKNVGILRPGGMSKGMHPRYFEAVVGRPAKKTVAAGAGLSFDDLQ
jgi:N-acetylneuraminate synthase